MEPLIILLSVRPGGENNFGGSHTALAASDPRRELNDQVERLQLDRYLTILETRPTLDVHDFDAEGDLVVPERLESIYATTLFRDESRGPINLLNLRGYKQNPTPSCLAGLEAYLADCGTARFVRRVLHAVLACPDFPPLTIRPLPMTSGATPLDGMADHCQTNLRTETS